MDYIFYSVVAFILLFGFVVFFGAPYLPTLKDQTGHALDLLSLSPGQTLLELGCGDGRVLRAAAERGLYAVGYELNPLLVIIAKLYTLRYRKQVKVVWGNFWVLKWPQTDGIFVFLLDKYMGRLDKKIIQEYDSKISVVSYAFKIPGKKISNEHKGMYLYLYGE